MANLNKVMLIGNLTRDAELRFIPSGQPILEFRIAVSRRFRTQNGENREETLFIDVNLWGKIGESIAQYMKRGKPVFVEGRLKLDEWERDGQKHSKMRVVADNIQLLGSRQGGDGNQGGGNNSGQRGSYQSQRQAPAAPSYNSGSGSGSDGGSGGGYGGGYGGGGYGGPQQENAPAPAAVSAAPAPPAPPAPAAPQALAAPTAPAAPPAPAAPG